MSIEISKTSQILKHLTLLQADLNRNQYCCVTEGVAVHCVVALVLSMVACMAVEHMVAVAFQVVLDHRGVVVPPSDIPRSAFAERTQ